MKHASTYLARAAIGAAVIAQSIQLPAQEVPGSVRDLVGVKASAGESSLEARGFTYITGGTRDDRKFNYWWNRNTKECVRVTTFDGLYEKIAVVPKSDCNQKGGSDAGTVAAVGAIALIGALALSHKSHDHDNYSHYGDANSEAQYERGYRDGLYSHSYHNYDRSQAYTSGYENGVRARGYETGYRNNNYYGGGYSAHVSLRDLEGQERSYVKGQLASRGFQLRDDKKTYDGRYSTYWRSSSRQCIIVTANNGYVTSIEHTSTQTCSY
ncbi:hypothetical protein GCM10023264_21630 [Sphingomonas daechungensis]|uniref:Uncharacterized protein n=1 Tax=Sphingomonas daechungensis TaxID=1176646 RepID=A0ABX6T1P3_9SPHN|nr:hypothetical protein [Sphingomonas daechungensis]QNP43742.1 hypothetical protein H9L15_03495 [Sphingomonas daechungensis]